MRAEVEASDACVQLTRVCALLQCGVCRSSFICTSTRVKLQEHVDGKHPKLKFEVRRNCLPARRSGAWQVPLQLAEYMQGAGACA